MTTNEPNADITIKKQRIIGRPFKPGQSGNPKGRPRGAKSFDTLFEEAIIKIAKEKRIPIKNPEAEMVARAVVEALKGNYSYYRDIMDRRYGQPKQQTEISTPPGQPLEISITKIIEKIYGGGDEKKPEHSANDPNSTYHGTC